jgi:hypothetical protein
MARMQRQPAPKEVDEFAETEVLDRRALEIDQPGHLEPAAAYEEYSRLLASEAAAPLDRPAANAAGKKRAR